MNKIHRIVKKPFFDSYMYLYLSIFLYSFFGILFGIYHIDYFRIPQLIGFFIFLVVIWKFVKFHFKYYQRNILFSLFIIWQLFIIVRVGNINIDEIRLILFEPIHFLSYLMPFVVFLPISSVFFNKKIKLLFFFSLVFFLLNFYLIIQYPVNNITDTIVLSSLAPVGILLLLSKYLNKFFSLGAFIIVVLILFIALFYGRRSVIVNTLCFIIFSFILNIIIDKKINFVIKFLFILISTIIVIYIINSFLETADKNSFQIFNRIDTDSRSFVFDAFYKDFKIQDYLIGRGIDGGYYNPMRYYNFSDDDFREVSYRTNIENGFLYMIMKGGIIYLTLFLFILFKAIYLGFFKSKNIMVKGLASYLFIYFIDMFAYGQPTFVIKYFLFWICISFCYSKKIRNINEKKIIVHMNNNYALLKTSINIKNDI